MLLQSIQGMLQAEIVTKCCTLVVQADHVDCFCLHSMLVTLANVAIIIPTMLFPVGMQHLLLQWTTTSTVLQLGSALFPKWPQALQTL